MNDCLVNFLSDIRVLVVDDDPGMLNSLSRLISSFELNVSTFSKGQELVSSLPDDGRCLVISDVRMFDMPGMAILRWITEHRTEIPVILVSAYADVGMAVHAMCSGAVTVLRKPYSEDELWDAIRDGIQANDAALVKRVPSREQQIDSTSDRSIMRFLGPSFRTSSPSWLPNTWRICSSTSSTSRSLAMTASPASVV